MQGHMCRIDLRGRLQKLGGNGWAIAFQALPELRKQGIQMHTQAALLEPLCLRGLHPSQVVGSQPHQGRAKPSDVNLQGWLMTQPAPVATDELDHQHLRQVFRGKPQHGQHSVRVLRISYHVLLVIQRRLASPHVSPRRSVQEDALDAHIEACQLHYFLLGESQGR